MAPCTGRLRPNQGFRFGEHAFRLFKDMDINHALPHALVHQKWVRMGRADRARIAGAWLAEARRGPSRAQLYPHQWSREAAHSFPPLPITPRPAAARHARMFRGDDV